jgi:hypothetical protein
MKQIANLHHLLFFNLCKAQIPATLSGNTLTIVCMLP